MFQEKLRYRPVFLGGLWKETNPRALLVNPNNTKHDYLGADFRRQAAQQGTPQRWPSVFPIKSTLALRVTLLSENQPELIEAIFDAYWQKNQDISEPQVIEDICKELGLDGAHLVLAATKDEAKKDLRDATQLAIDAGVFGAPTTVVHLEDSPPALYWGNDRLWMAALAARGENKVI
jgi:2-hydroxychromene-2-carboxylate isomerase